MPCRNSVGETQRKVNGWVKGGNENGRQTALLILCGTGCFNHCPGSTTFKIVERGEEMSITYNEILNNIKYLIKKKGMKQCAVAEKTDLSVKAFSDIMHGRKILKVEYIPRFAMALDVSIEELFKENCSVSIVKKGQKQSRIVQNASHITAVFEETKCHQSSVQGSSYF